MSKTKRISIIALNIALAFVLSYLETLIPLNFGIPGIKIGLANIVVVSALYTLPRRDAFFYLNGANTYFGSCFQRRIFSALQFCRRRYFVCRNGDFEQKQQPILDYGRFGFGRCAAQHGSNYCCRNCHGK